MMPIRFLIALSSTVAAVFAAEPANLLRNGSFEGAMLYWHNAKPSDYELVRGAGTGGSFACKLKSSYLMSAPVVCEQGKNYTISFDVRGDEPGRVDVSFPPSAREEGQKAGRLWTKGAGQSAEVGTEWRRVSFTFAADVAQSGFWPRPHYLVQIGSGAKKPLYVDGVTVVEGGKGTEKYVAQAPVEIVAEVPEMPGYRETGNIFEKGAKVKVTAHAFNTTAQPRSVKLRWELRDYEGGAMPGGVVAEKTVTIPAGGTVSETGVVPLVVAGCVLVRVSADEGAGAAKSDIPLTSLAYPKAAVKPDYRERFGGSFAGGEQMLRKFQRIGFGWTRWFPETKWHNFQKEAGAPFDWHDEKFALAERFGVSQHVVLYGWPKGLMDREHSGQPLPLDMRWPASDPRWDDLGVETAWDKYVKAAVEHFRERSVIFEIENEPEFDKWEKFYPEYAKFTARTARLIKKTNPKAQVMVNNVYGIPSAVNAALFKLKDGLRDVDVVSWHDYHAGWLTDATGIRRMRQALDEAGGKHVEIWFNEGWAFTNTAVDEPPACTHLTSAQSTNEIMASVAEMSVAGQKKTILFHTGYESHGMSFWDYSGPGTMLWDWYDNPLPLVAAWNVMAHHIGISEEAGFVRPPGANFAIFDDLRNKRGVVVAYADKGSKQDVTVTLPLKGLTIEDNMGNAKPLASPSLTLPASGRLVYLYDGKTNGAAFLKALESLDRKHAGFVTTGAGASPVWNLPPVWDGVKKGESEGSVAVAGGKPVWKLEQIWPPDWRKPEHFRAMTWTGTEWNVKDGGFGGQPAVSLKDNVLHIGNRAPHGNPQQARWACLTFIAPQAGTFALHGTAECRIWDGKNTTKLRLLKKSGGTVERIGGVDVPHNGKAELSTLTATLAAGDELSLLPEIEGAFSGGSTLLRDFSITPAGTAQASAPVWSLPAVWDAARGNPALADGKPVWRLDRVFPDDLTMPASYTPMVWARQRWSAPDHTQGGHPSAEVADGGVKLGVMGAWGGNEFNYRKTAALAFIAPESGRWRITASALSRPWDKSKAVVELTLRKRDTQRVAEMNTYALKPGETVAIAEEVDLAAGHELLLVARMPRDNNASTITLDAVKVTRIGD